MLMYLSRRAIRSLGHQVIRTGESSFMAFLQPQSSINGYTGKLFAAAVDSCSLLSTKRNVCMRLCGFKLS